MNDGKQDINSAPNTSPGTNVRNPIATNIREGLTLSRIEFQTSWWINTRPSVRKIAINNSEMTVANQKLK